MNSLSEVTSWLDTYLNIVGIPDSSWNGLQVKGTTTINKIALAVDAGRDVFEIAAAIGAQLTIVHHGHFWTHVNPSLSVMNMNRLEPLLDNDISLYAAHLPLDLHAQVGNNTEIVRALGADVKESWYESDGHNIGWIGEYSEGIACQDFFERVRREISPDATVLDFGAKTIRRVAVLSGSGRSKGFYEAINMGADTYVTGDPTYVYHAAKDFGMNVVFAGHYATETFGVRALGKIMKQELAIDTEFIDVPTGL